MSIIVLKTGAGGKGGGHRMIGFNLVWSNTPLAELIAPYFKSHNPTCVVIGLSAGGFHIEVTGNIINHRQVFKRIEVVFT